MDDKTLKSILFPDSIKTNNSIPMLPLSLSSIGVCISNFADSLFHKYAKKQLTKAGYDNVFKYRLDFLRKDTTFPARFYLECVNEYGAESRFCKRDKEEWLELKSVQKGNKVAWNEENEEEIYKMLKEDAIEAGYKEGYCLKKDPKLLKLCACEYEECIARHDVGAEDMLCWFHKKAWLDVKAFQNDVSP